MTLSPGAAIGVCPAEELPYRSGHYERFWAACQDLDIPIALHPGVHIDTPGACRLFRLVRQSPSVTDTNSNVDPIYGGSGLGQAVGNAVDMIVSMGRLLMGGVCERFPRLNFIFLESGGGWCPTQLERMDEQVETFSNPELVHRRRIFSNIDIEALLTEITSQKIAQTGIVVDYEYF